MGHPHCHYYRLGSGYLGNITQLDPYKPLNDDRQHLKVQVIALQYKWLFLYPDQEVASVNKLVIPNKWPIELDITSDAPMNSF